MITSGLVALVSTVGFVLLWVTSKGHDRIRMAVGAMFGFALSASIGKFVLAIMGAGLKALMTLFGA
jgi:CBS-domain-containing membrane protein